MVLQYLVALPDFEQITEWSRCKFHQMDLNRSEGAFELKLENKDYLRKIPAYIQTSLYVDLKAPCTEMQHATIDSKLLWEAQWWVASASAAHRMTILRVQICSTCDMAQLEHLFLLSVHVMRDDISTEE